MFFFHEHLVHLMKMQTLSNIIMSYTTSHHKTFFFIITLLAHNIHNLEEINKNITINQKKIFDEYYKRKIYKNNILKGIHDK